MLKLEPIVEKVSEAVIETYLCNEIRKLKGTAYKFKTPARRAAPDRLCVMPMGVIAFVECKRPGEKPSKAQAAELYKFHMLNHLAYWVSTKKEVDELIATLKHKIEERHYELF